MVSTRKRDLAQMRLTSPPSGLAYSRLPVVWMQQHADGCMLTIERLGPTCAIVWRVYPHYKAPWMEAAIIADSLDYDSNLSAAESMCELLLAMEAPEHMKPRIARQISKERHDSESAARGVSKRLPGRPATTPETKEAKRVDRERRKAEKARTIRATGPLPWRLPNGLSLRIIDEDEHGGAESADKRFVVEWFTADESQSVVAKRATLKAAQSSALDAWQSGPSKEALAMLQNAA